MTNRRNNNSQPGRTSISTIAEQGEVKDEMSRRRSTLTWKNSQGLSPMRLLMNERRCIIRMVATLLVVGSLLWLFLVYTSLSYVSPRVLEEEGCTSYTADRDQRFIIFKDFPGQGAGNIMSGLLAVHLLGLEFDRIVCVHPSYTSFLEAFEAVHPRTRLACSRLFQCERPILADADEQDFIRLLNFRPPPNECVLQQVLASLDHRALWIEANTYPRWAHTAENLRFTEYYQPTAALRQVLPWTTPPSRVVHLRAPDDPGDLREGLDDATLEMLGKTLTRDTYLVTNRVWWYNWFAERYSWSHPPWQGVVHSGLAVSWGDRQGDHIRRQVADPEARRIGSLQLWADWYTILRASSVIHTHSDFSSSAVHWMNIADSFVLKGSSTADSMEKGKLILQSEDFRRQEPVALLSQRQKNSSLPESQRLKHCEKHIIRSTAYSRSGFSTRVA